MNCRDDVRSVSDERVVPSADFAVAQEVWDAVDQVDLVHSAWLCCVMCRQGVIQLDWDHKPYVHTESELQSLTLLHMIQVHGWTRETASVD